MSKIHDLYLEFKKDLKKKPSNLHKLQSILNHLVVQGSIHAATSEESFCFTFKLPLTAINNLYKEINIDKNKIYDAFESDWGKMAMTNHMYADSYYQILLFILYYAMQEKNKKLKENAFMLILFKLWNGRKSKFLYYCDKNIMKYVVSQMLSNRYVFSKHNDPYSLLQNYIMPTLLKKYEHHVIRDPAKKTQYIFQQAFSRLRQFFVNRNKLNIKTGALEAQGGILPLYIKARKEGLSMSNPAVYNDKENPALHSEYATTNLRDDVINSTINYIIMNPKPYYSNSFKQQLRQKLKVKLKLIDDILISLHSYQYRDLLHKVLLIILLQTNVISKEDICDKQFLEKIQKNIIKSKNNKTMRELDKFLIEILEKIFKGKPEYKALQSFSNVSKIQLKKIVILAVVHNLQQNICKKISR